MATAMSTHADWKGFEFAAGIESGTDRDGHTSKALGLKHGRTPYVDSETLSRYHRYLCKHMTLPVNACYPASRSGLPDADSDCAVLDCLDPEQYPADPFSGILCRVVKGKYEVLLPLTELEIPEDCPNFQLIKDYCDWFWRWR